MLTLTKMDAAAKAAAQKYDRKKPLLAEIIRHEPLTRPSSNKDTRHFVFSIKGSGMTYTPGDSLAIFARNPPALVEELVRLLGFDSGAFREALTRQFTLNRANRKVLVGLSERIPQGEQRNRISEILNNDEVCREYLYTRRALRVRESLPGPTVADSAAAVFHCVLARCAPGRSAPLRGDRPLRNSWPQAERPRYWIPCR